MIKIYTDGACSGNRAGSGIGGYGYVIVSDNGVVTNGGSLINTTNNAMEMVAIIASLKDLHRIYGKDSDDLLCMIYSDSKYVVDNWNGNIIKWMDNNWKTSKGTPVMNKKYWELMFCMSCCFKMVRFTWVKGHDENKYNEMANDIAVKYSQTRKKHETNKMH